MNPLARRLLLVVGKGGVGRTTVAITLALAAGQRGQRAAVLELYGNDQVPRRYGWEARSYDPRAVAPHVDTLSLTPYECLDDFGRQKLKVNALVRMIFRNRVFHAFVDAVPGLHDLFQLGKINNLATDPRAGQPYDLLVVDAPATGHGLTLLSSARSMREMVGSGLVSDEAQLIQDLLEDPSRTGLVLVTLTDELPVNESLELVDQLGARRDLLAGVVVNQVRDLDLPESPPWDEVAEALAAAGRQDLIQLGEDTRAAAARQQAALDKLERDAPERAGHPVPVWRLPRIEPRELHHRDLPDLAEILADQLDDPTPAEVP